MVQNGRLKQEQKRPEDDQPAREVFRNRKPASKQDCACQGYANPQENLPGAVEPEARLGQEKRDRLQQIPAGVKDARRCSNAIYFL